jgi:plasmid stabilization system protein ParE
VTRFKVRIGSDAEAEFTQAFNWYKHRSHLAANGFRLAVFKAIDGLERSAAMWPQNEDGISFVVLDRYPYTIFFDLTDNQAVVLAIAHHRRRPGYWRSRSI